MSAYMKLTKQAKWSIINEALNMALEILDGNIDLARECKYGTRCMCDLFGITSGHVFDAFSEGKKRGEIRKIADNLHMMSVAEFCGRFGDLEAYYDEYLRYGKGRACA